LTLHQPPASAGFLPYDPAARDIAVLRACETVLGTGRIVARGAAAGGQLLDEVRDAGHELWPDLPIDDIEVFVDGVAVPFEVLPRARTRAGSVVTLRPRAMGKGLKLVGTALVALLAIGATLASGGAFAGIAGSIGLGGFFAAGSVSANLLALGLGLSAALLNYAIAGQPVKAPKSENRDIADASISGNVLSAGSPIQRVFGTMKVYPQLGCEPLVDLDGRTEIAEAIFVLCGEHEISDIRVDGTPIDQIPGVSYEIRRGLETDSAINLVRRWGHTETVNAELPWYRLQTDDRSKIDVITTVEDSLPSWKRFTTTPDGDEIWLAPQWSEGLVDADNISTLMAQPVRIRMRPAGETVWRNLPELHFAGREARPLQKMIKLLWAEPGTLPTPPTKDGVIRAFHTVPVQSATPAGIGGWQADAMFAASATYSDVARVAKVEEGAIVYLSGSRFPPGVDYEIEVMSGQVYSSSGITESTYAFSGTVYDLFGYKNKLDMAFSQTNRSARIVMVRHSTVYNQVPMVPGRLAAIAIRGVGVNLGKVSCVASGLVGDWDEDLGEWSNLIVTSNPAPHWRAIWASRLTTRDMRIGPHEIDNTTLLDWRDWCTAQGHTINMVVGGGSMAEVAERVAGCGYASVNLVEKLSVVIDRDRSSEAPRMQFTPRDARGFTTSGTFQQLPDGLRCTFQDAASDWRQVKDFVVLRPGVTSRDMCEARAYDGLTSRGAVRRRALHDLAEFTARRKLYSFEAPQRAIDLRRGSLVEVATDDIDRPLGFGRVVAVTRPGATITALLLDFDVDLPVATDIDDVTGIDAVVDVDAPGTTALMRLDLLDGTAIEIDLAGHAAGATRTIGSPLSLSQASNLVVGAIASLYTTARTTRRLLVEDVAINDDRTVSITARDEAPQLHTIEAAGQRLWRSGRPWASGRGWGT
jgi:hypothetical protein